MSYLDEWRRKLLKAQEEERRRDREKRGVKVFVIRGPNKGGNK